MSDQALAAVQWTGQDFFRQLIERGQDRVEIVPKLDPTLLAWLFSTVIEHLGDFLLEELNIDPKVDQEQGVAALDQARVESQTMQVVKLLERGSRPLGDVDAD